MDKITIFGDSDKNTIDKNNTIYIAPIKNLLLTSETGHEILINGIKFISRKKLIEDENIKISVPKNVSEIDKKFYKHDTYAVKQYFDYNKEQHDLFREDVNKALDILSLSQLIYANREQNAVLSFSDERSINDISFLVVSNENYLHEYLVLDNPMPLKIDKSWAIFQSFSFFYDLLKIINNGKKNRKNKIQKNWREKLLSASILAGKSQRSRNLWYSFLLNMIALEIILIADGEKFTDTLPERVEAFIGWSNNWEVKDLHLKVSKLYVKRCDIVHRGKLDITYDDLRLSDYFLFNILQNIVKHIDLFPKQEELVLFSKKVQAENLLGFESSVRPKTLQDIGHNKIIQNKNVPKHIWDIV
ncbi:HEPN domain-containing protein, partial [Legionella pneumophila serogroup 1]